MDRDRGKVRDLPASDGHCEPRGRANARPMTGSAKQSISPRKKEWIASSRSLLAKTAERHRTTLPNSHARWVSLSLHLSYWPRADFSARLLVRASVADLLVGCVEVPISRHGSWIHVPSDVRCCALQGDGIACSPAFWTSEFLASTGDVSEARATVVKAKVACLIRMGLSFLEKD